MHHSRVQGPWRTVLKLRCRFRFFQAQSLASLPLSWLRLAFSSVRLHQKQVRLEFVFGVLQGLTPLFAINP